MEIVRAVYKLVTKCRPWEMFKIIAFANNLLWALFPRLKLILLKTSKQIESLFVNIHPGVYHILKKLIFILSQKPEMLVLGRSGVLTFSDMDFSFPAGADNCWLGVGGRLITSRQESDSRGLLVSQASRATRSGSRIHDLGSPM